MSELHDAATISEEMLPDRFVYLETFASAYFRRRPFRKLEIAVRLAAVRQKSESAPIANTQIESRRVSVARRRAGNFII